MTAPATETLDREKDKLYLTDAELIRRLGVPAKVMRSMLPGLEKNYGFKRPKIILRKWRRAAPAQRIDFIQRVSHSARTGGVGMHRESRQISRNGVSGVWLQP